MNHLMHAIVSEEQVGEVPQFMEVVNGTDHNSAQTGLVAEHLKKTDSSVWREGRDDKENKPCSSPFVKDVSRVVSFESDDEINSDAVQNNIHEERMTQDAGVAASIPQEIQARLAFDVMASKRISQLLLHEDDEDDEYFDGLQEWSLDDFDLIRKLGSGGSATVYMAREKQSGFVVALKGQSTEDGLFQSEIDVHECLRHANVIEFFDYFFSDALFGQPVDHNNDSTNEKTDLRDPAARKFVYMILELGERGSLYDVASRQPKARLGEPQAARMIKDALVALSYIHEKGILHCDIKTSNFVVARSYKGNHDVLKLADFGLSVRQNDDSFEVEGGSLLYMAPEHLLAWRDQTDEIDERVDIYGLGVVLFEILVGEFPYAVLEDRDTDDDEDIEDFKSIWENVEYPPQIIDLESLHAETQLPLPVMPDFLSNDVCDLLMSLLRSDASKRISLEDALRHPWIQNHAP